MFHHFTIRFVWADLVFYSKIFCKLSCAQPCWYLSILECYNFSIRNSNILQFRFDSLSQTGKQGVTPTQNHICPEFIADFLITLSNCILEGFDQSVACYFHQIWVEKNLRGLKLGIVNFENLTLTNIVVSRVRFENRIRKELDTKFRICLLPPLWEKAFKFYKLLGDQGWGCISLIATWSIIVDLLSYRFQLLLLFLLIHFCYLVKNKKKSGTKIYCRKKWEEEKH